MYFVQNVTSATEPVTYGTPCCQDDYFPGQNIATFSSLIIPCKKPQSCTDANNIPGKNFTNNEKNCRHIAWYKVNNDACLIGASKANAPNLEGGCRDHVTLGCWYSGSGLLDPYACHAGHYR